MLRAHGIAVVGAYPQRTAIDARAGVSTISRFFHVVPHRDLGGLPRADRRPDHPRRRSARTSPGVVGLERPPGRVRLPTSRTGRSSPTTPRSLTTSRRFASPGIDGTGQTIAILSLSPFPPNGKETADDVSTFRGKFAPKGPDPVDVKVYGGGSVNDLSEDDLDIDVVSRDRARARRS